MKASERDSNLIWRCAFYDTAHRANTGGKTKHFTKRGKLNQNSHSFTGWMMRPQSLYMVVCCLTFFFFFKLIIKELSHLTGSSRVDPARCHLNSRLALPHNQLWCLRNANCCLTTIQRCMYACCMNNSHKNIFQTADWAWLFLHRMQISRCWKSTPVFRNFSHQPITMVVQNVHHICFSKNINTDDRKLDIFVSQHQVLLDKQHANFKDDDLSLRSVTQVR